ncbi:hypothetical protein MES4922_210340 [Mesorhizobium ventifaucium]|uniref:Uncharacterized protein n=1 Tax=Mesorhizobium ventifaucium TaxID=666020 RepID=A0ABM9DSA7_9HYPH|nr:hypothetical protein MES4922_210340 [Mesorhizobium ventifaucium]
MGKAFLLSSCETLAGVVCEAIWEKVFSREIRTTMLARQVEFRVWRRTEAVNRSKKERFENLRGVS